MAGQKKGIKENVEEREDVAVKYRSSSLDRDMKKYRIKEETSTHTGRQIFIPQRRVLGLFWMAFERSEFSGFDFDTLEEARNWLRDEGMKKGMATVIHEA